MEEHHDTLRNVAPRAAQEAEGWILRARGGEPSGLFVWGSWTGPGKWGQATIFQKVGTEWGQTAYGLPKQERV